MRIKYMIMFTICISLLTACQTNEQENQKTKAQINVTNKNGTKVVLSKKMPSSGKISITFSQENASGSSVNITNKVIKMTKETPNLSLNITGLNGDYLTVVYLDDVQLWSRPDRSAGLGGGIRFDPTDQALADARKRAPREFSAEGKHTLLVVQYQSDSDTELPTSKTKILDSQSLRYVVEYPEAK